ncbi:MAG: 30S ribosomal protein S6 [Chloroflexi bacterium]|nr:30S ribosomal protein S6 [Chloroflexota bacterium]
MRNYEITYIIHPDREEAAFKKLNEQVATWVKDGGGKIVKTDIWGKRKMAYEIRKQTEGNYVLLHATMEASAVAELERQLRLQESVMRFMIVSVEEDEKAAS